MNKRKKAEWINDFSITFDWVDGFLQINEEEAQVVRQIFEWYSKSAEYQAEEKRR
ncbi:hypothetical protein [Thermoactinomyces sp. CICC 10523]|uniref:hypothetical protein n=1 Tax=Thermoactinomyces sp. CICC 10523 TaxID=2767428 RepID=UPI0018DB21D9|nr:hypothetical protein [Thermoactinomyces sp. CICC 10523]MBH8599647.1 hypothetical protein [Thermoactinomyces sp. CICC 10523]